MSAIRWISTTLVAAAIVLGTVVDRPQTPPPIVIGGYQVIAADFHTHSSMWSSGGLTPWGLVLEAERHGLDAIAITGHNEIFDSRIGRRFSAMIGGPIVFVAEEIVAGPNYHMVAVGVKSRVGFRLSAADAADEIHRQGGVAIAAHPNPYSNSYNQAARERLDGAEICHPNAYRSKDAQAELEWFSTGGSFAAIGSSDFHGIGEMGICRTYVFATDRTEQAILEAVRARRTIVYGPNNRAYGDRTLAALAVADGRLTQEWAPRQKLDSLEKMSTVFGITGLIGLVLFGWPARGTGPAAG